MPTLDMRRDLGPNGGVCYYGSETLLELELEKADKLYYWLIVRKFGSRVLFWDYQTTSSQHSGS